MPCYEIRKVSVEFKVGSKDMLLNALNAMGLSVTVRDDIIALRGERITINLKKGMVEYQLGRERTINKIKVAYSTEVVKAIAQKKHWVLKQNMKNNQQFQATRY